MIGMGKKSSPIGQRIRALRLSRVPKLNQTELAALVNVDQSVISDIENGAGFKADLLMELCEALRTSPDFIMRGGSERAMQEAQLIGFFRECDDDGRAELMAAGLYLSGKTKRNSSANPFNGDAVGAKPARASGKHA